MKLFSTFAILLFSFAAKAQTVDSLFFNLYTDSLKKAVYNYINVDGKLSNGNWIPLTDKELIFKCNEGKFQGNSLLIDSSFSGEKVTVRITLKENPKLWKEINIYIKQFNPPPNLKTTEEILRQPPNSKKKRQKNSSANSVSVF